MKSLLLCNWYSYLLSNALQWSNLADIDCQRAFKYSSISETTNIRMTNTHYIDSVNWLTIQLASNI